MKPFILSDEARRDLFDIWDYIAKDSIDAADLVAADLRRAMARVAQTPGIGHWREDLATESLRFYRVHSYLIVYRPNSKPLGIVRVLHAARDIRAVLG